MSKLKKYKSVFWGVVITIISSIIYIAMSDNNENMNDEQIETNISNIPVSKIKPDIQNIVIPVLGKVQAQKKFDVYSEVNGIISKSDKQILSGTFFRKGEVIGQINSDQFKAELTSLKSSFKAKLVSILAIVKLDFPESFDAWNKFLNQFDLHEPLSDLPKFNTKKESLYFVSNGIEEFYYRIKSQEELLKKYTLTAPFDGFLTEVAIKEGALLTVGQRVATFIGRNQLDIVIDVQKEHLKWISKNDTLILEGGKKALITRFANSIDQNTQTVQLYATINDQNLLHGEYISGEINCSKNILAYKINRKLIVDDNKILITDRNIVKQIQIEKLLSIKDYSLFKSTKSTIDVLNKISGIKVGQKISPVYVK